jgi:uncharacterized protein YegP (UPF0339 family)
MADQDTTTRAPVRQPFVLYAANGRIYARNRTQKVIDLGAIARDAGGAFRYELDGNHQVGEGFFTEEEALHAIARDIRFLWLDGQFTAVADARDQPGLNLDGATRVTIELDEMPPGERAYDATV